MTVFSNSACFPTALLEQGSRVIGGDKGMPRAANLGQSGGFVSGGGYDEGVAMFYSSVEEALANALHELLYGGDSKVEMNILISNIEGGTENLSEGLVLEGLHLMDEAGLSVREDGTGVGHYRTYDCRIETQLALS